jgi:hypothetical protein
MEAYTFRPPRRYGLLIHSSIVALLGSLVVVGLQTAAEAQLGLTFLLAVLPTLTGLAALPWLIYRTYALWTATYTIERDSLRLQWGLRVEEIPMNTIAWVRPASTLGRALPLPWSRLAGAVVGVRRMGNGTVEYLASQQNDLIIIATTEQMFAISPRDPQAFLRAYRSQTELGSFATRPPRSAQPAAIFTHFWPDRWARLLVLGLFTINLALFAAASLAIPAHATIPLRFDAQGAPLDFAPGVRLMLLPIISGLFGAVDFLLGLFLYRRETTQIAAYLLWAAGLATGALLLGAVTFLINAA